MSDCHFDKQCMCTTSTFDKWERFVIGTELTDFHGGISNLRLMDLDQLGFISEAGVVVFCQKNSQLYKEILNSTNFK